MNKTIFCCFLVGVLLSALAVECSAQSHFVRFSLDEAYIGEYPPQENRDILRSVGVFIFDWFGLPLFSASLPSGCGVLYGVYLFNDRNS